MLDLGIIMPKSDWESSAKEKAFVAVLLVGYFFIFLMKLPGLTNTSAEVQGYSQNLLIAGVLTLFIAAILVFFFTVKEKISRKN